MLRNNHIICAQVTKNRLKAIYFRDGLPYYCCNVHPEYDEEVWKETLEYPYEYQYDDCRFMNLSDYGDEVIDKPNWLLWEKTLRKEMERRGGEEE